MLLKWFGQSCFRIQAKTPRGDTFIVTDPYSNKYGLKKPRLTADILTVSHEHEDHADIKSVKGTSHNPEPFLIKGPGEYEVNNIFIYGIPSWHDNEQGKQRGPNTIYVFSIENMTLAHLGDLGQKELTAEQLEYVEEVDILLIPVGGTFTLNAKEASNIISQIEPRIVIPMHYHLPGLKIGGGKKIDGVDKFIKEFGNKKEELDKLRISKKDLPQEETKLIVLKP
jgi:L-ascorbate metabolism protein UlaG (beta-lactamase superfamily)